MKSGKFTNILLLLVLFALMANLLMPFWKPKEAAAVVPSRPDNVAPAVIAAEVDEKIAPDRLTAELAAALRDIASANREIATAIQEDAHSSADIAYALDKIGAEMRAQRSNQ